ncbi:MAG: MurR/RpiR family transcriptional regulator [Oscillospiraceae bacterium]|nr:MurR/RpiR family transcriptional regulator [Oscillospiraceae bacterium]MCL2279986.1 MurR/RpiR family transcriptional regulator [Oscillospiraceae bacterium]
MRGLFIKMRELLNTASDAERAILKYMLKSPKDVLSKSVHEVAAITYTSSASVVRLCKRLGFDGYKNFRLSLAYELAFQSKGFEEEKDEISGFNTLPEIVDKITQRAIVSLEDSKKLMDFDTLEKAVELTCKSNTIAFFGIGASLHAARDGYFKFMRVGKSCVMNEDWHYQLVQARNMTNNDVGIALSYSGQTSEVIECIKAMKQNDVPVITMTRYAPSAIAQMSDCPLYLVANEPLFRRGAMSSRLSQLNMIDILFSAYVSRNYDSCMARLAASHIEKDAGDPTETSS